MARALARLPGPAPGLAALAAFAAERSH
jgi:hypothetical protein